MSEGGARDAAGSGLRVAIVGGGWAGLAAAVAACEAGHRVVVREAARTLGGRARTVGVPQEGADDLLLDNGQHILIGAYAETLALMRQVGAAPDTALARRPLALVFPDGNGLRMPDLPAPWNVLLGVLGARGWQWADRWSLVRTALDWQRRGFACAPEATVQQLCAEIRPRVMAQLIEPLCVSALNTPASQASGTVFLRVLRDALFGPRGSADLLLPRTDLGALLPGPANDWLAARGARVETGQRVGTLSGGPEGPWQVDGETFDRVVLACPPGEARRLLAGLLHPDAPAAPAAPGTAGGARPARRAEAASGYADWAWHAEVERWMDAAAGLRFEAITTVYLRHAGLPGTIAGRPGRRTALLPAPMLALPATPDAPAQFVFDRGQLGGPAGLLACVVSASTGERDAIAALVLQQAADQLGLDAARLSVVRTVVEKRATFACTPGLARPGVRIAPGLLACGDYVEGPYPATLEGAVRSGRQAAALL